MERNQTDNNEFSYDHLPSEIWLQILESVNTHWRYLHLKRVCKIFNYFIYDKSTSVPREGSWTPADHKLIRPQKIREIKIDVYDRLMRLQSKQLYSTSTLNVLRDILAAEEIAWRNEILRSTSNWVNHAESTPIVNDSWQRLAPTSELKPDVSLSVGILGHAQSGKKSLLQKICENPYGEPYHPSRLGAIFVQFIGLTVQIRFTLANMPVGLKILLFDITNNASFRYCVQEYPRLSKFIIVGNKADLDADRKVDVLPCKAVPRYTELSAKTGIGIDDLITTILNYFCFKLRPGGIHDDKVMEKIEKERSDASQLEFYLPVKDFHQAPNWRFAKKNELKQLSRDFRFNIKFRGPENEVKALMKAIQLHGPCSLSKETELSTYIWYENKFIVELCMVSEDHPKKIHRTVREVQDLLVSLISIVDLNALTQPFLVEESIVIHAGIIPEGNYERRILYNEMKEFFDVCPSTYANVERLVGKIMRFLRYRLDSVPQYLTNEIHWIEYEKAPKLDKKNPIEVLYKSAVDQASSALQDLRTNVTWRWHNNGSIYMSSNRICIRFLSAQNVQVRPFLHAVVRKQDTGYARILYEDRVSVELFLTTERNHRHDTPKFGFLVLCFDVEDYGSFEFIANQAKQELKYECLQVLFLGLKYNNDSVNRKVQLNHLHNTTERYTELFVNKPESVDLLVSKLVYCLTGWLNFNREITKKELKEAFKGVVDKE